MLPPRRFLPSVSALRALESLDRLGSASAVAKELSQTQSAVSRQLQSLEDQLGVGLIDRSNKNLSLTPQARTFVTDIRPALTQIAQSVLRLQVPPVGGAVNLAILPAFGMRWLMPRLPDFARLYPDVTINMTTRLAPFDFGQENFDAAIWYGDGNWPHTHSLLLRHEQVLPVCTVDIANAIDGPHDLLSLPLLHIQTRPSAWAEWFATKNVNLSQPVPGTLYDQFSTIVQAAVHGLGIALLPDYLVEQELATGKLVAPCGAAVETSGAYFLVWPSDQTEREGLGLFAEWMADQAEPEDPLPR